MSYLVRLLHRDIDTLTCEITKRLDAIGDIRVTIPLQDINDGQDEETTIQSLLLQDIEILHNGVSLVKGVIREVQPASIMGAIGYLDIQAEDELGWLRNYWAKALAHYQGVLIEDIITDLFTIVSSDWELGDISTLPALSAATVNLKSKERLWAQVVGAIEALPYVHCRYGGVVAGKHQLDIGQFAAQDSATVYALQGRNIANDFKEKRAATEVIQRIRPRSGKVGASSITLDNSVTTQAGFPVLLDGASGEYYVENSAVTIGADIARAYREIRTANTTNPSSADLAEAIQSLYDRTVRDLQQADASRYYSGTITLPILPRIGDMLYIDARMQIPVYDPFTEHSAYQSIRNLNGFYRIVEWSLSYKKGATATIQDGIGQVEQGFMIYVEVTNGQDRRITDNNVVLAKKYQRFDEDEPMGAPIGLGGTYRLVQSAGPGLAADCNIGAVLGRLVTIPHPIPIAANFTSVETRVTFVSAAATRVWNTFQAADLTQPLILCFGDAAGGNWGVLSTVTVRVEYTYFTNT